jgi:hypothetical protein
MYEFFFAMILPLSQNAAHASTARAKSYFLRFDVFFDERSNLFSFTPVGDRYVVRGMRLIR